MGGRPAVARRGAGVQNGVPMSSLAPVDVYAATLQVLVERASAEPLPEPSDLASLEGRLPVDLGAREAVRGAIDRALAS
jgi:hypothetical protein